ncbi:uncharacterized protein, partial [Amphiura filiformis]|uniref:uncharacterized protein n=1 Tax=Amphiura filiformis TaxID=82378 RepID=UPI003B215EB9
SEVCSHCKIAIYCSDRCREDDQYRHKPECEIWGPKKCNNPSCSITEGLKECSGCNDAWYCSQSCQLKDRSNHKVLCQKRVKGVKEAAAKKRDYFQKRSGGPLSRPYYVGNNIAIDMLNLQENECDEKLDANERAANLKSDFSILQAGCGNLRNTILTVASLPVDFTGKVSTVLNDYDPFIQARNVLFLCMMIVFATKPGIAELITTIWYSVHLTNSQYTFLRECLTKLTAFTGAALASVTHGLVNIPEEHMRQLREVWRGWLELQCDKSHAKYIDLKKQDRDLRAMDTDPNNTFQKWEFLLKKHVPKDCVKSVEKWLKDGDFQTSTETLKYDNPTLTGYNLMNFRFYTLTEALEILKSPRHHKFIYCIAGNLSVFGEWDQLLVQRHNLNKSLVFRYHVYITSLVDKTVAFLKDKRLLIKVHVCNGLQLSSQLPPGVQFDRIFTSNIADYVGTKTLLKTFKPLLKTSNKQAVLITQYLYWCKNTFLEAVVESNHELAVDGTYKALLLAARKDTGREDIDEMLKYAGMGKGNTNFFMLDNASGVDPQAMINAMSKMGVDEFLTQEYFNNMVYFISLLRADLMACDQSLPMSKAVPFQKVTCMEGFKMQDFRRELNRVVPFAYRRNARPVNLLKAMERMVEWRLSAE